MAEIPREQDHPAIHRDGIVKANLSLPKELGGPGRSGEATPEHFLAALAFSPRGRIAVSADHEERGVYLVDGVLTIGGQAAPAEHLVVLPKGRSVDLESPTGARVLLLGGSALGARRFIWWNFVSSSKDRIEQAKADWEADRMGQVPGETERIPLPER